MAEVGTKLEPLRILCASPASLHPSIKESTKGSGRLRWPHFVDCFPVEESQPSGLSGPYAHAPCWLKVSFSLKLRSCAPQLPPEFFSDPQISFSFKMWPINKKYTCLCKTCHFVNFSTPADCESTVFGIKWRQTYGGKKCPCALRDFCMNDARPSVA